MTGEDNGWLRTFPIAHRGLHGECYPENSLPAFEAALTSGYGIELDVHASSDGRLIVMHDENVVRMTGTHGFVTAMSAQELTRLRLSGTEATIPVLDEVLGMVDGRVPVLIEIKSGSAMNRVGPAIADLLRRYSGPVAVQSFDPRVLRWLGRESPHLLRGQISGSFSTSSMSTRRKILLRSMLLNAVTRPDFIAFEIESMPSVFVAAWRHMLGVPLLLWTVRTDEQLGFASRYGANVIFEGVRPAAPA